MGPILIHCCLACFAMMAGLVNSKTDFQKRVSGQSGPNFKMVAEKANWDSDGYSPEQAKRHSSIIIEIEAEGLWAGHMAKELQM